MNDQSVLSNVIVCQLLRRPAGMFEFHYRLWLFCCQICGPTVQRKDGTCPFQIVSVGLHCFPIDSQFMVSVQEHNCASVQSVMYCRVRIGVGEHYIVTYYNIVLHIKKQLIALLLFIESNNDFNFTFVSLFLTVSLFSEILQSVLQRFQSPKSQFFFIIISKINIHF